jgi:CRP/FNR family transcriptional regulator, cyclic AMP receptor protein
VRSLGKLLNIRLEEWPRFSLLYLMGFIFVIGIIWGEATLEAAFLEQVGVERLALFFVIKAVVSIPAFALYTIFADRVSNSRLMIGIALVGSTIIAIGLLLLSRGLVRIAYPLLYLVIFVPFYEIFAIHWYTYVNGFYDTRAAKRIIPVLATANGVGGIVGGSTLPLLNRFLTAPSIVAIWMVAILGIALLTWLMPYLLRERQLAQRRPAEPAAKEASSSYVQNVREGFQFVVQSSFLRWMAAYTFLLMLLLAFMQYRTSQILLAELQTLERIANFIGILTAVTSLITLPIQLFLLSRIIGRVGVGNANLIFPVGTVGISGALVLLPGLPTAALAYFNRTNFYADFGYLTDSLLYNAVPLRVKGRARAFIGGLIVPLAGLLAGLLLSVPLLLDRFLSPVLVLLAVAVLLVSLIIRRQYGQALIALLEDEDYAALLSPESTDLAVTDPAMLAHLKQKLEASASPEFTIFMCNLMIQVGGRDAVPILSQVVQDAGDARVRSAILDTLIANEVGGEAVRHLYQVYLADRDGRVRQSALNGLEQLAEPGDKQFLSLTEPLVQDPELDVRVQALSALVRYGGFYNQDLAVAVLSDLLSSQDPRRRAGGVQVLGQLGDARAVDYLIDYLEDPVDEVRLEAAVALEELELDRLPREMQAGLLAAVRRLVQDPVQRVRQAALTVLGRIGVQEAGSQETQRALVQALSDISAEVRATAADILVHLGKAAVPAVHPKLDSPDTHLRKMATVVLARINPREFAGLATSHITGNLLTIYGNVTCLDSFAPYTHFRSIAVLQNTLREQNQQLVDEISYLLSALHDPAAVNLIFQSLRSDDPYTRANAVEALEALTTPQTAQLVAPLFGQEQSSARLLELGRETWAMEIPHPATFMRELIAGSDDLWLRSIVTYALGEMGASAWSNGRQTQAGAATDRPVGAAPPRTEEAPPARRGRGRRSAADIFNSLLADSDASGQEKAAADAAAPAGPEERKPAAEAGSAAAETLLGNAAFTAEDVRRLSRQPVAGAPGDGQAEALFTLAEIETFLAEALVSPAAEVRTAAEAANRIICGLQLTDVALQEGSVLSTIEKIIFLKEVPFFQGMTIDQLKILANVCEEQFFAGDARIFEEGDPGGALYVVISGRVAIEQEKRKGSFARLATLGPHAYFGEMNLFDNSPRSASAIAVQDTLTLRLRREPLIALARQYPGLSLELINVLSARLRETSDRIAELTKTRPRELHKLFDQFD